MIVSSLLLPIPIPVSPNFSVVLQGNHLQIKISQENNIENGERETFVIFLEKCILANIIFQASTKDWQKYLVKICKLLTLYWNYCFNYTLKGFVSL